jgi:AcrR family transcriptional regulator
MASAKVVKFPKQHARKPAPKKTAKKTQKKAAKKSTKKVTAKKAAPKKAAPKRTAKAKRKTANTAAPALPPLKKPKGQYHHGNLRAALVDAGAIVLESRGVEALSLREAARRAGVSQTAPYRHFENKQALLAAVAGDGFQLLLEELKAAAVPYEDDPAEAITAMGAAYINFAAEQPARFRLMFGRDILQRHKYEALDNVTEELADTIGGMLPNPALGLGLWSAMHGLAWLLIEDVADMGGGRGALTSRAEIVLRSLVRGLEGIDT